MNLEVTGSTPVPTPPPMSGGNRQTPNGVTQEPAGGGRLLDSPLSPLSHAAALEVRIGPAELRF